MKICTITCSNTDNHGARLQTYALAKYLQNQGNDVSVVDYRPPYMDPSFRVFYWPGLSIKEWAKFFLRFPQRIRSKKRHKNFVAFSNKHLPLTEKVYRSIQDLRQDPPSADMYIAGSDQIWNTFFFFFSDPAFYLDFGPKTIRRESYAASFATTQIKSGMEDFVRKNLSRFDKISVREESGLTILEQLGIRNGVREDDPVFLLSAKKWEKLADGTGEGEHYLLVYDFFSDTALKQQAKSVARSRNLRIFAVCPFKQHYADKDYTEAGPESFLSLVKNADIVVTNSYHAIAFCDIFKREYLFVPRPDGLNERIEDLIKRIPK